MNADEETQVSSQQATVCLQSLDKLDGSEVTWRSRFSSALCGIHQHISRIFSVSGRRSVGKEVGKSRLRRGGNLSQLRREVSPPSPLLQEPSAAAQQA